MESSASSPTLYALGVPQGGRERNTSSTSSGDYIMMKKRDSSPLSNQGMVGRALSQPLRGYSRRLTLSVSSVHFETQAIARPSP